MELERSSSEVGKKLWKILKIAFYMLMEALSKSKSLVDLQKTKLAGKAFGNLILYHYYSVFTCRSINDVSFISPQDHEFSCSNTPFYASYFAKRKSHHQQKSCDDINIARKVFELFKDHEKPEGSPFIALPGFGQSPVVRQLRISDSPFPLKVEKDPQGDKAAEDFIRKFYKELKQQKRSLSPYSIWAR
ncbi:hypothetical protein DCAR_0831545 [Daucus carota subsp. sativus]|uniref:Uncharacterized protein n=1 Tax=Daucus carota subsp. sativus TaxID=79200 RepID=A0A175YLT2_DAUCS|nr:PREDICTED: uncharacterized protein LOC108198282 [Daucus carota subsp. sativus]WOH12047.1 hypothetical protein DCAR_0831545 [Daucus carota subsp. sativus]